MGTEIGSESMSVVFVALVGKPGSLRVLESVDDSTTSEADRLVEWVPDSVETATTELVASARNQQTVARSRLD